MKKIKYHYNFDTGIFEPIKESKKISYVASILFVLVLFLLAFTYKSTNNKSLVNGKATDTEINDLRNEYLLLNKKIEGTQKKLSQIEKKDDKLYRGYFNLEPVSDDVREAGSGGVDKYKNLSKNKYSTLIIESNKKLDNLNKRLAIESQSLDEVINEAKKREKMFANLPAIQPISNKDLTRLASGFGMRVHPILKISRFHSGIDFTASMGTPVYATANGTVNHANYMGGYGNVVKINHGYGYETLYAHLSKINVSIGEKVKRGEVIGLVGTTGLSSGAHLHYEVSKDQKKVNPISFFIENITAEEYKILVKNSSINNQSFD